MKRMLTVCEKEKRDTNLPNLLLRHVEFQLRLSKQGYVK